MSSHNFQNNLSFDGLSGTDTPDYPPFYPDMPGAPSGKGVASGIFTIVYACLIIASNIVMIVAYFVEKRLQTYNNSFIINLIISDLLVGFSLVVFFVTNCTPSGSPLCKIFIGVNEGLLSVSVITIVVICADRHRATYDPIKHFTSKSNRKACLLNSIPWVVAFVFWILFALFGFEATSPINGRSPVRMVGLSLPILMTLVPLVIITVLYARILYKIRTSLGAQRLKDRFDVKSDDAGTKGDTDSSCTASTDIQQTGHKEKSERKPGKRESEASARKATRSLSFIIISFLVSWMPYVIFVIGNIIDESLLLDGNKLSSIVLAFILTVRFTNSFLNPLSYAAAQPLFRHTVAGMFCNPKQLC
ncbi:trace amine-associated receptor 8a-like [Lytechinus variegatus]|uniref:trace amine-associated receptor 8a-like n=1 Tax=Lytechinus variegatus TaxID=7654 RepID=UPI001BB1E27F|nr:trace amine-associated receptor 8a-like [Lytechinus variegatus]